MSRKLTLKGFRSHGKIFLHLSKLAEQGVRIQDIPPYFTIEIDMGKIKPREKEVGRRK